MPNPFKNWAEAREAVELLVDLMDLQSPGWGYLTCAEYLREAIFERIPTDEPEPNCPETPDGSEAGLREAVEAVATNAERKSRLDVFADDPGAQAAFMQCANDLRDALASADEPPSPWLPIAEAPRDGTAIVVTYAHQEDSYCVRWQSSEWWTTSRAPSEVRNPTHWMPLPTPPEQP